MKLAAAIARELLRRGATDDSLWILDGDLGDSYGLDDAAVQPLSNRFIQAGIAEQAMVTVAAGLASCGARPWVFSFASFLCSRAYDQIRVAVSQTGLPVALVGSHAGGCTGPNGKTHAMLNDLALMASLPNLDVWAPADCREATEIVGQILSTNRPAYIRLPRDAQQPVTGTTSTVWCLGEPDGFAIVSTGLGTQWAVSATRRCADRGIDVPLIHVGQIAPFPTNEVAEKLRNVREILVVEDHYEFGGLATLLRQHFPSVRTCSAAWPSSWTGASGASGDLRRACGLDDETLANLLLIRSAGV
jgi:transketolase